MPGEGVPPAGFELSVSPRPAPEHVRDARIVELRRSGVDAGGDRGGWSGRRTITGCLRAGDRLEVPDFVRRHLHAEGGELLERVVLGVAVGGAELVGVEVVVVFGGFL
jgi:hypothetical protein